MLMSVGLMYEWQGDIKYHPSPKVRLCFVFSVSSHAAGVAAACALDVESGRAEPLEFLSHVFEILFTDFRFEYFFDDRKEVGQRTYGGQGRSIGGEGHTARPGGRTSVR